MEEGRREKWEDRLEEEEEVEERWRWRKKMRTRIGRRGRRKR